MNPKYPVYIPSKGRWERRLTVKGLEVIGVPYHVVVEPSEYDNYAAVVDRKKILVLPSDNMKLIGSRNWIMEHSISIGAKRHWQLDDNMDSYYRVNRNMKLIVKSGATFRAAEDFVDRYTNVAIAGFQYNSFVFKDAVVPPFRLNTRIYSCSLINNEIPYRWRSVYNDDTDICLQALKGGWCTVLFNAFLVNKETTMRGSGGNTDELYLIEDGRKKMAQALVDLHPDVATMTWKFNRW